MYLFLYFPLVIVLIFSFSPTKTLVGMHGVTLKWYQELFRDGALLTALLHTVLIGLGAVSVAVVLGVSGAFFVTRVNFPGKGVFRTLVLLPYILPGIIMGISLLIFIQRFGVKLSWFTVLLGHVSFTVPIVMFQIMARLARMGPNYQSAAMDLGANPAQTFLYVTLPMIRTAIVGASAARLHRVFRRDRDFVLPDGQRLDDAARVHLRHAPLRPLPEGVRHLDDHPGTLAGPHHPDGPLHGAGVRGLPSLEEGASRRGLRPAHPRAGQGVAMAVPRKTLSSQVCWRSDDLQIVFVVPAPEAAGRADALPGQQGRPVLVEHRPVAGDAWMTSGLDRVEIRVR